MNKTAKKINAQIELNDDYKKLNISDFKLPDFKPMPDIGNITNAYLSAFNTGMTVYECLSWLQGYVQANRDALAQLIGDLNKFQESIENALNSIVENLKELDAKLEKETEDRKAADIILDGKIATEKEERTAEDARLDGKIDQTKEDLNTKIDEAKQELDTKIDNTKQELDTKIDETKKELDESLKNLDTYVKKTGDDMTGPLVLKSKTDEASPILPEKGGAITFYTDENSAAEGLPADYITVSKSYITNRPQSSLGNTSIDRVYGMHFHNSFEDTSHQKQRFIFNQNGDYRILVRNNSKPEGEKQDLLWGEQIAYLSDLEKLPKGGVTTQRLTPKTTSFSDNASTSAVAVQVETEEDLSQFKMLYVCLVSQNVPTALGVSAITFLMPISDYGWGETKTLIDPAMHLYYVGCQGVTDGKINFNVANLSGTAANYTINSIVGIK